MKEWRNTDKSGSGCGFAVSIILIFCMLVSLAMPAFAAETELCCQLEEHVHSEECYEIACTLPEQEAHTHDSSCFLVFTCEMPETEGHTHTEECYVQEVTLLCELEVPESDEAAQEGEEHHSHEDSCWQTEQVLVCELPETSGHMHDEDCWTVQENPICGLENMDAHAHDESCMVLSCGLEEHLHSEDCFQAVPEEPTEEVTEETTEAPTEETVEESTEPETVDTPTEPEEAPTQTEPPAGEVDTVAIQLELLWQGPGAAERKSGSPVSFWLYRSVVEEEPVGQLNDISFDPQDSEYLGEFTVEKPNWIWSSASVPGLSLETRCADGWYVYYARIISDDAYRTGYLASSVQDGCFRLRMVNTIPTVPTEPSDFTVSVNAAALPEALTLYRHSEEGSTVRLQIGTWDHDATLLETQSFLLPEGSQVEVVVVNSTAIPVLRTSERIDEYTWETFFTGKNQERSEQPEQRNLPVVKEENKYTFAYTVGTEDVSLDLILGGTMDAAEYTYAISLPEQVGAEDEPVETVILDASNDWTKTWTSADLPIESDGLVNLYYIRTADGTATFYQPWETENEPITVTPVTPAAPEAESFSLTVATAWKNPYGEYVTEGIPQEGIPFDLYSRQRGNAEVPLTYVGSYAVSSDGACVIPSLPLNDGAGMELEYIVVATGGRNPTYDGNCTTTGPITIVLELPTSITVQVVWEGEEAAEPVDSITFALYRRELMARPEEGRADEPTKPDLLVRSFTVSPPDWRWEYSSDNLVTLPLIGRNEDGNTVFYFYYVVEQGVPDGWRVHYSDERTGIADGIITVTNSIPTPTAEEPETPDLDAMGSITVEFPVNEVLYRIYRVGDYSAGKLVLDGQFGQISTDDLNAAAETISDILLMTGVQPAAYGWVREGKVTFTQLPQGVYLVMGNRKLVDGVEYAPIPEFVFLMNEGGENDLHPVISGKYKTGIPPTEVSALAVWDGDTEQNRPAYVKVQLLKSGTAEGEPVILSKDNNWRYIWKDLDPAEKWSVVEVDVPQYYVCSTQHVDNTFVLFNKRLLSEIILPALPQTGQYWWPVFVMAPLGLLFVAIGLICRRKGEEDA